MYVLAPLDVDDSILTGSSLAETEHAAWGSGTAYVAGNRVVVSTATLAKSTTEAWAAGQDLYWNATLSLATTVVIAGKWIGKAAGAELAASATGSVAVHAVFEAVAASTGNNPVSNAAGAADAWVRVGATNRWKAFDETISDQAVGAGDISYQFTVPSLCTGLAFFNLSANAIAVTVKDGTAITVYSSTTSLATTEGIVDWYEFFTWDPTAGAGDFDTELLLTGFAAYAGYTIDITVQGSAPKVGEIVVGHITKLGTTTSGTEVGFEDYSRKDRDDWGNAVLVKREYRESVVYRFAVGLTDMRRVRRIVAALRATPAVWFAGETITNRGATIYGFPASGLRVPLEAAGFHFASLEIEGLT